MSIICDICPQNCKIKENQFGKCNARQNIDNFNKLSNYGKITNIAVEPIEKKPFFHYFPGSRVLSIGSYFCSFSCSYCANFKVSQQDRSTDSKYYSPNEIIQLCLQKNINIICFTYNEPIIMFEYVIDVCNIAKNYNIKVVLKTNGYCNQKYWDILLQNVDSLNIDYKGNSNRYTSICEVDAQKEVLSNIEYSLINKRNIEISIPIYYDLKYDEYDDFINKISNINPNTPIHLLKVYPINKYILNPTSDFTIYKIYDKFREYFNYVYIHNIYNDKVKKINNTKCHLCLKEIVTRDNTYNIEINNCDCNILHK